MEDSLDTYISQSLIDRAGDGTAAGDTAGVLGSELLMQMLLSTMGAVPADGLSGAADTVDPSSLNAMDIDDYAAAVVDGDSADTNSLLAAALLSALGPLPEIAAPAQAPVAALATVEAAGAQAASPAAAKLRAEAARGSTAAQPTRAARPPAPAAWGPLPAANAAARRPAPRAPGATAGAPERAAATASPSRPVAGAASNHDDDDDDDDEVGMEGIDLKSLTSKERRQLRNKISARNFRVRRKEYISNLEGEVRMHKEEADGLRRDLLSSRKDNALLREEVQRLRQRLSALGATQPSSAGSAPAPASARVPAVARTPIPGRAPAPASARVPVPGRPAPPAALPQPQPAMAAPAMLPAAPMVRFNPHKDIPQAATKKPAAAGPTTASSDWAAKNSRSSFVTVNTAVLPLAHRATAGELLAEARRKQAVDALLDMGAPAAIAPAALPQQPSPAVPANSMLDSPALLAAALCVASQAAEFVLLQCALESSFAQSSCAAVPAALPAIASC